MRHVHSLQILGNPSIAIASPAQHEGDVNVYMTVACPTCSCRCNVFEDGSIICVMENKCFEPDPTDPRDADLVEMRRKYDEKNGITASQRLLIPAGLITELNEAKRQ